VPFTPFYRSQLRDPLAVEHATIPVEKIRGPVQLVSGMDDQMWPSSDLAKTRGGAHEPLTQIKQFLSAAHHLMHQTKRSNQWYFGMKIHIGADVDSGTVHSVRVTAANRADISELANLLRETDQVVFGDAGYASDEYKRGARALEMVWRADVTAGNDSRRRSWAGLPAAR
jgi:IS5 family transposase